MSTHQGWDALDEAYGGGEPPTGKLPPTPPPRQPWWHRHPVLSALGGAVVVALAAGGITVAVQGHPAAQPTPARTSAPVPSAQAPQPSSPPPSTPSEADQVIAWRDAGGSAVLQPLGPDLQSVSTDTQTIGTDAQNGDVVSAEGSDAQALMSTGMKLSADASAALADPPPGSLAAPWSAAMTDLQTVGKDCVRVASDLQNDDIATATVDVNTLNTDLGDGTSALSQAMTQVQQIAGQG